MDGLVLGLDLCDDYCRISGMLPADKEPRDVYFVQADGHDMIQTTLGRKKDVNQWVLGKGAYELILTGEGFVVDKLLTKLENKETVKVGNEEYSAVALMSIFIGQFLEEAYREFGTRTVDKVVIAVQTVTGQLIESLQDCGRQLGFLEEQIHIVGHTESFLFYMLSEKKEYWNNESVLFDWSGNSLHYYSMSVQRGVSPQVARVEHTVLEENFPQESMEEENQRKLIDTQLAQYAAEALGKRVISAIGLCGKNLEKCNSWPKRDLAKVLGATRRKVYAESNVFAKGAVRIGCDKLRKETAYPYTILCEGRIPVSLAMKVLNRGERQPLVLAKQGNSWYNVNTTVNLILDGANSIDIDAIVSGKTIKSYSVPLDGFPKRPSRTTRVEVRLHFTSETEAVVTVKDKGFGDFFAQTQAQTRKGIRLDQDD